MSEITNDNQSYDAQQLTEEIEAGEQKAPDVNVSADYEASKQFSVSEIDRSGEGEKAAEAATAPHFSVPKAEEPKHEAAATGDPSDYREMAKEVNHAPSGEIGNVDDNLMKKAIEKGQAAQS